tara:strand:- start:684 stop:1250 length:567 start_codon:yes stop_codon:yes gene_type:complete
MKRLEIVFTKSKKFFPVISWLIRWWTSVMTSGFKGIFKLFPYSHVARSIQIKNWGRRYYQASEGRVNYEFEKFFIKKHNIVKKYELEVSVEVDREIKKACYEEAGNKYASWQNIGIFLTDIYFKIFHKEKENPWKKGRNCSEILYAKCFKIMIPELDYDENKIKPHEIEQIILKYFRKTSNDTWILKM